MPTLEEDRAAIESTIEKVFSTYIDKDLEGMLSCYAPDLVTLMPFGMPTYGLDAWRPVLESAFERLDVLDIVSDIEEIAIYGDSAWAWYYEWAKRRRIDTGDHFANFIRAAVLMKRQPGGQWKISRYIANAVNLEPDEDFDEHVARFREHSRLAAQ